MTIQHTQANISCWKINNTRMGIYAKPHMKSSYSLPFNWIWNAVNYFAWLKVKVPMRGKVTAINISFFIGCIVSDSYYTCHDMSGVISDTKKYEERFNCIFLIGDRNSGWTSKFSALYFSNFVHAHAVSFLKSRWYNLCFIWVPWMLLMNI